MSNLPVETDKRSNEHSINFYSQIDSEININPEKTENKKKKKVLFTFIISFILLIFSFFIGLIFFFPLDKIFEKAIQSLSAKGIPIVYSQSNFSILGSFSIDNISIKIPVKENIEKKQSDFFKVQSLKGNVNLWNYLLASQKNKKIDTSISLSGIDLVQKKVQILGDSIFLDVQLKDVFKHKSKWSGRIKLKSEDLNLRYENEKIKLIIGKGIKIKINKLEFSCILRKGYIYFEGRNFIDTNLVYIKVTGKYQISGNNNIDISVVIDPKDELYTQYKQNNLKELFTIQGILQEDNKIYYDIKGNLKHPSGKFRINKKQKKNNLSNRY